MTGQVDPAVLLKFQLAEATRHAQQLQAQQNARVLGVLEDVVNGLNYVTAGAAAGDANARRILAAISQTVEGAKAAAASKIVIPPGIAPRAESGGFSVDVTDAPVEEGSMAEGEAQAESAATSPSPSPDERDVREYDV